MKNLVCLLLALNVNNLVLGEDQPRFSIGLGVLAPSYSQKFAGNGRLDVDQDKNGFSYSLSAPHGSSGSVASYQSQSSPQSYGSAPQQSSGSDYASPQSPGQFSIYQHRSVPKAPSAPGSYGSPSEDNSDEYAPSSHSSPSSSGQYNHQANLQPQQYTSPALGSVSGGQDWSSGGESQDYNNNNNNNDEGQYNPSQYEGQSGANSNDQQQGGQPHFGAYNFEQQISHQIHEAQPFQSHPQSYQSSGPGYPSEPSHQPTYESQPSPAYQSQPSHQRIVRLQSQPIQRPQMVYMRP